jgi:predicted GNAT family N-acyltransferase
MKCCHACCACGGVEVDGVDAHRRNVHLLRQMQTQASLRLLEGGRQDSVVVGVVVGSSVMLVAWSYKRTTP